MTTTAPGLRLALPRASRGGADGGPRLLERFDPDQSDVVEHRQGATLNSLEESIEAKARRMRSVLAELGQASGGKFQLASAMGGPFIPVPSRQTANSNGLPSEAPTIGGIPPNDRIGVPAMLSTASSTRRPAAAAGPPGVTLPMRTRGHTPIVPIRSGPVGVGRSVTVWTSAPRRKPRRSGWPWRG